MQLQADRLSETAIRNWDETLIRLKEAIGAGLEATQRERQTLSEAETEVSPRRALPSAKWHEILNPRSPRFK